MTDSNRYVVIVCEYTMSMLLYSKYFFLFFVTLFLLKHCRWLIIAKSYCSNNCNTVLFLI